MSQRNRIWVTWIPHDFIKEGEKFNQNVYGFFLVMDEKEVIENFQSDI